MTIQMNMPAWVVRTWHVSALLTAILLAVLAWSSYRTSQTSLATERAVVETVVELRQMNAFWDRTLRRADSLRALQDTGRTP